MFSDETKTCLAICGGIALIFCAGLVQFWNKLILRRLNKYHENATAREAKEEDKSLYQEKSKQGLIGIFLLQLAMAACIFFGLFLLVSNARSGWNIVSDFIWDKEVSASTSELASTPNSDTSTSSVI